MEVDGRIVLKGILKK